MVGVKRRVDTGDDRKGKRTKTKTAVSTKGKSAPVKAQKGSKSATNGKDVNGSKKDKKALKKKAVEEEEDDEISEEDDFDVDDIEDSEIEDVEDDVGMDDVDAEDDEDENEVNKEEFKDKKKMNSKAQEDEEAKSMFYPTSTVRNPTNIICLETSSRESHIKQKALLQERKAAKPNADQIARSKKLWERLRRKSHVPLEERKKLIAELFDIITGRVKDFVFKHDSVRVIQTALKYANVEQRKQIAHELKGSYVELAQSKYAKFLIGKLIVHGDSEIRDLIIAEFYGKVKRLIRHPEGSWILDDIYRTVATQEQQANLLREWYGAEFAIFRDNNTKDKKPTSDLSKILEEDPAKRSPIMHFLLELINQLIQKKTTGFTMLHDAMLQYFLNVKPGTSDATEFIELIKGDEEGDLVKNLAFTKSGARLMCLALAYSTAKDRKHLTRFYKDTIKMMAGDLHGHLVLLAAYEVIDDTKLTAKFIFPELLNQNIADEEARNEELLYQSTDLTARIPILYPFASDPNNTNTKRLKWLLPEQDFAILDEIRSIRKETSKKDPAVRRMELIKAASPALLDLITARAESLLTTSFGCQFLSEVLFDADDSDGKKRMALSAVATAAKSRSDTKDSPFVGRMLKSLVQGGRFNVTEKKVEKVSPPLGFDALFYEQISDEIMAWATGSNVYVIVALVESEDFEKKNELIKALKKGKKDLETAAKGEKGPTASGAKLLLEKVA
jgi:pumilio family protein 6